METRTKKMLKTAAVLAFGLSATSAFAVDACKDAMSVPQGSGHSVNGNQTGSISGTKWGFEQWFDGGNNSMKYYDNGTFEASWSGSNDYLARVGFRYGDNGPGKSVKGMQYTADYKYTKTGNASYGYIGIYGWTVNPQVEYYIVDDWFSKPNEQYVGDKFGEITVDGATYTIHAFVRQQEPSKTGTSTFLQIFSVRQTPRQCGHIDIQAHFDKWNELFTGQQKQLKGSKGGQSMSLKFGDVTEVMLMTEAGGGATGSVEYTYFDMSENGQPSEPPKEIERKPFGGTAAAIPGTVEAENFDEGNYGVTYSGVQGASGDDGDHDYRGEDYASVDIVAAGEGRAIGYTAADEWLEYTVNVAQDGEYDIVAYVSNGSGAGKLNLSLDGKSLASLSFTGTQDDWNAYEEATGKATLTKGEHVLRITIANANTNVDYVKFSLVGGDNPPQAIAKMLVASASATYSVFDFKGQFIGKVEVASGSSVAQAIKASFHKAGVYMVKNGNVARRIAVK
ncbi:MAG: glycoside hydrolase family 11 protein [Fibrobacter sp.]|nr:glycoside hydrolase family 11 protein [Fibrobacter sp.]